MSERADLPDYATMRRAIRRLHRSDVLVGIRCPHPECGGTLRRERSQFVCDGCRRDAQLG